MRIRVQIAYFLIGSTYIVTLFSILFGCHPMHKNWQIYPDPGSKEAEFSLFNSTLSNYGNRFLPACGFQN